MSWIKFTKIGTIILVDNTHSECDFRVVSDFAKDEGKTLEELIAEPTGIEERYGKGAGEGLMINHAISSSKWIDKETKFYKITGRLFVSNFNEIAERHAGDELVFSTQKDLFFSRGHPLSGCKDSVKWRLKHFGKFGLRGFVSTPRLLKTDFFKMKRSIYEGFLKECYAKVDDRNGYYLEHAIYYALRGSARWDEFRIQPHLVGVSGSSGRAYGEYPEEIKKIAKILLPKVNAVI